MSLISFPVLILCVVLLNKRTRNAADKSDLYSSVIIFLFSAFLITAFLPVSGKQTFFILSGITLVSALLINFNAYKSISINIFNDPVLMLIAVPVILIFLPFSQRGILAISVLAVSLSGFLSLSAGRYIQSAKFRLTSDLKSAAGSIAYFISGAAVISVCCLFFSNLFPGIAAPEINPLYIIYSALLISIIAVFIEALSSHGLNYIFGTAFYTLALYLFLGKNDFVFLNDFALGLFFAVSIAGVSYRLKFLTMNGSVATLLLAGFLFGFGGLKWSVPILAFFILSSLLSKFRKKVNEEVELYFDKSGVRDYVQVFANGGLGGILVVLDLLYQKEIFYLLYISVLAAVCADTWATEIGTLKKRPTYNITNLKPVEQGISGGISVPGILASILGAFVISLSGVFWINESVAVYILLIILAGTAGSLFDSFLGATIQVQHRCRVCSKITERKNHCGSETNYFKGIHWINNDVVNLFAGISGGVIIVFLNAFI